MATPTEFYHLLRADLDHSEDEALGFAQAHAISAGFLPDGSVSEDSRQIARLIVAAFMDKYNARNHEAR